MHPIREQYYEQMKELSMACNRVAELGYVTSHGGNLSMRVADDVVLITPTKVEKRNCTPDDVCAVSLTGETIYKPENRKPTSESPFHLRVYQKRPDLRSVVHAHPPILTGYAIAGVDVMATPFLPECAIEVGPMIMVPYAQPGSDKLAEMFDEPLKHSNGFLMENHGALMTSADGIMRTVDMLEMMENAAQSALIALQLGRFKAIPDSELPDLEAVMRARGLPMPGEQGYNKVLKDCFK